MSLVLQLSVRINHYLVSLDGCAFDTLDLVALLVEILNTVEQPFAITFLQLQVSSLRTRIKTTTHSNEHEH